MDKQNLQSTVEQSVTTAQNQPYPIRIEYLNGDRIQYSYDTSEIVSTKSSPCRSVKNPVEPCQLPTIDKLHSNSSKTTNSDISVGAKCKLSEEEHIRKEPQKILLLLKKLLLVNLWSVQKELRTEQLKLQRNPLLLGVLNLVRSLEIYAYSLFDLKMSDTLKRNKAAIGTASTTTGAVGEDISQKDLRPNDDFVDVTTLRCSITANSRRTLKNPRTPENVRLMLIPESPEDSNEKDSSKYSILFIACY